MEYLGKGQSTWDALALDGLGDDGSGLVACLGQSLTQLLHAVPVHHDGIPAAHTDNVGILTTD